jgi:hypothetical protein
MPIKEILLVIPIILDLRFSHTMLKNNLKIRNSYHGGGVLNLLFSSRDKHACSLTFPLCNTVANIKMMFVEHMHEWRVKISRTNEISIASAVLKKKFIKYYEC